MDAQSAHAIVERDLGPGFLGSKITAPRVQGHGVRRGRLVARIGIPPAKRLVLVNAPAGFGKSTLLAAWSRELAVAGVTPAWLSLDAHDADVHHFLGYVAAALNAVDPAIGPDVIEIVGRRGRTVSPALLVQLLLAGITAHEGRMVLVLDDYHAAAGTAIDHALSDFIVHAPPNLHVVIAGRGAPRLRLDRLRATGEVVELGPSDLAFNGDEVRAFFGQVSGFDLTPHEVAQLRDFSEGWPACVQLAAIAMRRKQDLARVLRVAPSPGREIARYLQDDVLQGIEPELRAFLLRTAILERFDSALAGAVAEVANARALMEALERRQLFLIALDDRGEWFRYHPLFGNYLRDELERECKAQVPALHRKASAWLADAGLWGEAVRHAMTAGDPALAMAIVERCALDLVRRGDFLTLIALLRTFPDQAWRRSIPLLLAFAWALAYSGGATESAAVLADVEQMALALPPAEQRSVETVIVLIRLTIAVIADDTEQTLSLLARVDPALGDHDAWASDIVNTSAAFVHLNAGEPQRAREFVPCIHPFKRVYQQVVIALSWLRQGRPDAAMQEMMRAQELALGEFGARSIASLICRAALAPAQYERGEFDQLELGLGNRLPVLDEVAPTDVLLMGYASVAWARAATGGFAEAEQLLQHLRKITAERHWLRAEAWALLELVRLRIARGAPDLADLAPRLDEIGCADLPATRSTRWEAIMCARLGAGVAAAMRQVDARVVESLAGIVARIDAEGGVPFAVKAQLLLAYVCVEHRAGDRARAAMERALRHARTAQMLRSVDDSGAWARKLAADIAGAPHVAAQASLPVAPEVAAAGPTPELSVREREILELVGRGYSNKEIGKTLQIAPETVKWHVKNLFAKLGVANRMQAVNRVRQNQPSA